MMDRHDRLVRVQRTRCPLGIRSASAILRAGRTDDRHDVITGRRIGAIRPDKLLLLTGWIDNWMTIPLSRRIAGQWSRWCRPTGNQKQRFGSRRWPDNSGQIVFNRTIHCQRLGIILGRIQRQWTPTTAGCQRIVDSVGRRIVARGRVQTLLKLGNPLRDFTAGCRRNGLRQSLFQPLPARSAGRDCTLLLLRHHKLLLLLLLCLLVRLVVVDERINLLLLMLKRHVGIMIGTIEMIRHRQR